jgi:hypothetical protein
MGRYRVRYKGNVDAIAHGKRHIEKGVRSDQTEGHGMNVTRHLKSAALRGIR